MEKYGKIAIFGRPNTGKSSLLNAIMNQKVSITSHLPQTTRRNMLVRFQNDKGTIDFIDTPGIINKVEDLVGKKVNLEAPKALSGIDLLLVLMDISRPKNDEDTKVLGLMRKVSVPKILVYTKIDLGEKHLAEYNYMEEEFDEVIKVSGLKSKNIKGLINMIMDKLPESEPIERVTEMKISMDSNEYIGEIIREKAYLYLREEVPYTVDVKVLSVEDKGTIIVIKADLITIDDRYKKMIIGEGGRKIKEIGHDARKEFEVMSGRKVYLELTVKTNKHWMENVL